MGKMQPILESLAEGESFGDMGVGDDARGIKVGDGGGDLEDFEVRASGEVEGFGGGV